MKKLYFLLFFISFSVCNAQLVPTISGGVVTGYSGSGDTLVIPSEWNGISVTEIGEQAFYRCTELTTLTLPDSLTKIGKNAFYKCTGLTTLTLPDSITEIGEQAFYQCTGLTTLTLPDSLTEIGSYAFYSCTGLTSLTLPDSLTEISDYAFQSCTGLTTLTLPDSLTEIGSYAFYQCTNLRINNLPASLTTLGSSAFYHCGLNGNLDAYGLPIANEVTLPDGMLVVPASSFKYSGFTKINLHENVQEIQDYAFSAMPYLTEITIPASVNFLGSNIFSSCDRLTTITFEGNLPAYSLSSFSAGDTGTAIPSIYYKNFSETWELHNQAIGLPLIYLGPPTISLNPQDISANLGSSATMSVSASDVLGSPLNYQWLKNGLDINEATTASINFQSIAGSDAGNYQVKVSNGNGTTISESASVSISSNSTAYSQEQYDAALTTGFNLGVQSVSGGGDNSSSGYTLDEIADLRGGSTMVEIENGQANLSMEVEQSNDLGIWTTGGTASVQINVQPGEDKKFFRFKMSE